MTDAAAVDVAQGSERAKRARVLLGAVAIAAVLLALGGWAGWVVVAGRAADQVAASWALDCTGEVGSFEDEPAIHSRPGWKCDVDVTITNDGGRSVHVTGVKSPFLGPGGGAEIQALSTKDAELRSTARHSIDAAWATDLVVPAGESRTFTITVGWREDGCNSGGHLSLDNWPTIELETLRRTFDVRPPQVLVLRTFDDFHDRGDCRT